MDVEEFKNNLNNIISIQDLPIVETVEDNIIGDVKDLFSKEYSFLLKDGCSVKMSKDYYICAQEGELKNSEIYKINSKYNTIFRCFTCGSLVSLRDDLIEKYDPDNIIPRKVLFPMRWKEQEMIAYIENLIYIIKSNEN